MKQKYVTHCLTVVLTSNSSVKVICTLQFSAFCYFLFFWSSKKGDMLLKTSHISQADLVFTASTHKRMPKYHANPSVLLHFLFDLQISTPKYSVTAWKNLLYSHPLKPFLCKTVNLENTMLSPSFCRFLPLLSLWKQSAHQICQ